jgi:hypothetical protein
MEQLEPRGRTMRRGLGKVAEAAEHNRGGPASPTRPSLRLRRAFQLTNRSSRSTVEPESGGYLGDVAPISARSWSSACSAGPACRNAVD